MELLKLEKAWQQYIAKHQGRRGYAHFDSKNIHLGLTEIQEYVCDQEKIAHHSFYPFIQYIAKQRKAIKKDGQLTFKDKERMISYSSHKDNCIYQRYAFLINQYYNQFSREHGLDGVAVAYRDNLHKAPHKLAAEAFEFIEKQQSCFIMVSDFSNFFDKIQHAYLKRRLCQLMGVDGLPADYYQVFKNITKYGKCQLTDILKVRNITGNIEIARKKLAKEHAKALNKEQFEAFKHKITKNKEAYGTPQGSPLSAVLANVYMMEYDLEMNGLAQSLGGKYMRYSDDTIMILPIKDQEEVERYFQIVQEIWSHYEGLVELQPNKTKQYYYENGTVVPVSEGTNSFIDFLGLRLTSKGIAIKPKCFTKYHHRMQGKAKTIKRQRKRGMNVAATNLYKHYGDSRKELNLVSYLHRVARDIDLSQDKEAQALLKGGAKRKIRKALK